MISETEIIKMIDELEEESRNLISRISYVRGKIDALRLIITSTEPNQEQTDPEVES